MPATITTTWLSRRRPRNSLRSPSLRHLADFRQRGHGCPALGELSISDAPLYETVELEFLSRINFCSRPDATNDHRILLRDHVENLDGKIWNSLHQRLQTPRAFFDIVLMVAVQFMVI